jgi:hypothetical protein
MNQAGRLAPVSYKHCLPFPLAGKKRKMIGQSLNPKNGFKKERLSQTFETASLQLKNNRCTIPLF